MIKPESPKIYRMPMAGEYLHDLLSTVDPTFQPEEVLTLTVARIDALSAEAQERLLALAGESLREVAANISYEKQTLAICREERLQLQGITRALQQRKEHLLLKMNERESLSELSDDFNKRTAAYLRIEQRKEEELLDLQLHFTQLKWLVFALKTHQRRMQPDYQVTEEETMLSLSIPLPTEPFTTSEEILGE